MNVTLDEDAGKPQSVFDRMGSAPAPASNNVRAGLFGSALTNDDEDDGEDSDGDNAGPTFRVTLSGAPPSNSGERRNNDNNRNNVGSKGGKKNGGNNGRRNNNNKDRAPREPKKEVNLDDALDNYMKANKKEVSLDDALDNYMKAR